VAGTPETASLKLPPISEGGRDHSGSGGTTIVGGAGVPMTVQELCCGMKRDKAHYEDLKDDMYFNSWNHGFCCN
jgi:hypothetical protein